MNVGRPAIIGGSAVAFAFGAQLVAAGAEKQRVDGARLATASGDRKLEHFPLKWTPVWCRKCDKQTARALSSIHTK